MILLLLLFILVLNAWLASLAMKYFKMYTKSTKYPVALDAVVFLVTFVLLLAISIFILMNTITIGR